MSVETVEDALSQLRLKSSVQEQQAFLMSLKSVNPRLFRRIDRRDIKKIIDLPMPLQLSLTDDAPTLIEDHNVFPLDDKLNPSLTLITIGSALDKLDENFGSYLEKEGIDFQHIFPIVIELKDADKEGDRFSSFIDEVILSLIERYPDMLIQLKCVSYKLTFDKCNFNGLFFTSNDENAEKVRKYVEVEYKNANSLVWLVTKNLKRYHDYDNNNHQFKTLNSILEHLKLVYGDYTIGNAEDISWLTTDKKIYRVSLIINYLDRLSKKIEIVEKIILDVPKCEIEAIFEYLQSYTTIEDTDAICGSQKVNGSFNIHTLILKHLQISSIEPVKRFTGSKELKNCDELVWQTAFVITYLEHVLAANKSEWKSANDEARKWINNQLGEREVDELFSACYYYLIEVGANIYNKQEKIEVVEVNVDEDTEKAIFKKLVNNVSHQDANVLCKTQSSDGYFTCEKVVIGEFEIPFTDKTIDSLKRYVSSLSLKRIDKTVWVTAFVMTYFEKVLINHKHEWNSANNDAKRWIQQRVSGELEKELSRACMQFLTKKGCEFLTGDY